MTTEKKEPKIGDIIRIVLGNNERMGRVENFTINEFGCFIKLSGHHAEYNIGAIDEWQFLKIDNQKQ